MWFQSGRRRDLCAILYDAGELRGQQLKRRVEAHYDTRLDPQSFYGTLDALVSKGHLSRRTEDIHEVYGLTERGEEGVESYYEWLTERVEAGRTAQADESDGSERSDEGEESDEAGEEARPTE
ncbi:DNA-binding protein [Halopelagius longus]|uniref:DNA-binding protein n=1 Tax=Halopelagius longus TaxID=1236180 RepID=A0A1H1BM95_9EURY|nr:DNA-binding protein [Halopelagius longus]RDI70839.1 DNA-binding protein [Halopelagius longus]SDQ52963.1 hypothetical protein SAMN05216278_1857 [Halopelagius longus]